MACKKFPENNLWFKRASKIPVIRGKIVEYRVNKVDSLQHLNSYYVPYVIGSSPPKPPYTNIYKNIYDEKFVSYISAANGSITSDLGSGDYQWDDKLKNISIFFTHDKLYFNKNIFIKNENILWEVMYLDKKGKSKIKTTYNGNTYEITFEY